MDFIFLSSVQDLDVKNLVVSYDIACQWRRNLPRRNEGLPHDIRLDMAGRIFEYVIPKFHIAAHGPQCQCRFSLNFRRHMARTDGENIERGWAWMNPAAGSSREMGPGGRHDLIDDIWGFWNWSKVIHAGMSVSNMGHS